MRYSADIGCPVEGSKHLCVVCLNNSSERDRLCSARILDGSQHQRASILSGSDITSNFHLDTSSMDRVSTTCPLPSRLEYKVGVYAPSMLCIPYYQSS